jgi:flagellar FliL protein
MAEAAKKGADKKSADKDAADDKKSGKGKLLLIIVGMIVVGAGCAGGAMFWMKSHQPAPGAAAKEVAKKPQLPAIFVPIDPPFVVNFQSEQTVRFLQIAVQVMTHEQETADLMKQNDPIVKNDLLLLFGGQKSDVLATREGKEKLQADALAAIRAIITKAGGKGESVEALYFTNFVMQ